MKQIALAGNPNVGKSTVFNALTGMHQHTGNWPGKTVALAQGVFSTAAHRYDLVDLPGTYSLMAHSAEEEVARNYLCFEEPDAAVVVCDATCLERNLNLVLQTMELCPKVLVCINLMDEAKRKGICIDSAELSKRLGVPVVETVAQKKKSLKTLCERLDRMMESSPPCSYQVRYDHPLEEAAELLTPVLADRLQTSLNPRWLALRLLEGEETLLAELNRYFERDLLADQVISCALETARTRLAEAGISAEELKDRLVGSVVTAAEELCRGVVLVQQEGYRCLDRKLDRVLTGRRYGYLVMIGLLAAVLWLTITGANYPSSLLSDALLWVEERLNGLLVYWQAPEWLIGALVQGAFRVLSWVVAVMLPPMAIFFPLFTLLEDAGYLPRIAYNLDKPFQKCRACGKQALTMCMGFGCNAVGVTGCRIIDSPRERMIAILTNSFVPCNGRFPTLITLITVFFVGVQSGTLGSVWSAILLTGIILLGILATFGVSRLLSATLLKGTPSSFTLELPPYRKPQVGKVLIRSILDRTLFVLGRAAAVAAPAGLILWLLANITVGELSLLAHIAAFLDPFGKLLGMDGAILIAFVLGFPANEIVLPIILMIYLSRGTLSEAGSLLEIREILVANGWTSVTALCTMLFSLFHWPCSTTLLTVRKETGSWGWTAAAALLPTLLGMAVCFIIATLTKGLGLL
ncbi:MAG: ferrous iron transport protein B [Clostridia bacterium]|nr:ferrous iron transport protein B [Clostridia bacterium]